MAEVVTRGRGRHEQIADRAELRVTFAVRGTDRATAVALLGSRLPSFDHEDVEVRTRRLDVHAAWEDARRAGCTAALTVVLRVSRVDVLEQLLAAPVATEPDSLAGPHWELSDDTAAVARAQERAVADARRRAAGYAAALGGLRRCYRTGPRTHAGHGRGQVHDGVDAARLTGTRCWRGPGHRPPA